MNHIPATGALKSPLDIRTFSFPTTAYDRQTGGERYKPEDIEDQSKVGICTAISLTQNARKATGIRYSADFQYLIQKKFYDGNWDEGSFIFHALKAAKGIGLLPEEHWTFTTQADRDLPYHQYIEKLRTVPEAEVGRLIQIANGHRIKAYASVPVTRDALAAAIDESRAGVLARYVLGEEWWTDEQGRVTWDKSAIQPLRPARRPVSGHAVTDSNYDGSSFRIANSWGKEWADGGTAYRLHSQYTPTEAWMVYYNDIPPEIEKQVDARQQVIGKIMDLLQQIIGLLAKL